jgi:hypothetical protein
MMAKFEHLYSTVSGHTPASLLRGQIAINIPDRTIYANDPTGRILPISSGVAGLANAAGATAVHINVNFHPVAQFGVGLTQQQLQTLFVDNGTTATLQTVPIFVFGRIWYTPVVSMASSTAGAYALNLDTVNRTVSMSAYPTGSNRNTSGFVQYSNNTATLVFYSDSTIYPWFYLPQGYSTNPGGSINVYRVSPIKTFGAIPVSAGFAGAAATSYWGAP